MWLGGAGNHAIEQEQQSGLQLGRAAEIGEASVQRRRICDALCWSADDSIPKVTQDTQGVMLVDLWAHRRAGRGTGGRGEGRAGATARMSVPARRHSRTIHIGGTRLCSPA